MGQRSEARGLSPKIEPTVEKNVPGLTVPTAEEGSRCGWRRTADGP